MSDVNSLEGSISVGFLSEELIPENLPSSVAEFSKERCPGYNLSSAECEFIIFKLLFSSLGSYSSTIGLDADDGDVIVGLFVAVVVVNDFNVNDVRSQ